MFYPIKFEPVYKQILWGGKNIEKHFKRKVPYEKVAESWELCCRDDGMGIAANGAFKGRSLSEIIQDNSASILGDRVAEKYRGFFPLLIKTIDANDRLSVQVHPDDDYAKKHGESNGKNEIWYIIDCKPDAKLIYGLKPDITKEKFLKAIEDKKIGSTLNEVSVKPGDTIFIPAGTVHAILDGILISEIQQNSNTTYRIYDWDRVDKNGKGRELHLNQALDVINFGFKPKISTPVVLEKNDRYLHRRISLSDYFTIDEIVLETEFESCTDKNSLAVISNVQGSGEIEYDGGKVQINLGDTVLLPAYLGKFKVKGNQRFLLTSLN